MTVNPSTGVVSWTPNGNQLDTYNVTLAVTDGKGGTAQQVFKVKTQMGLYQINACVLSYVLHRALVDSASNQNQLFPYGAQTLHGYH
ncbi:hypothetical protein NUACC21_18630 [Scytonema sp. NUACC21]